MIKILYFLVDNSLSLACHD